MTPADRVGQDRTRKDTSRVGKAGDRPFDWVAALAVVLGAAVMIPSLAALVGSLVAVFAALLWH